MKSYTVIIPIAGHVTVNVDADNVEDAIQIAKDKAGNVSVKIDTMFDNGVEEFTWEFYDRLTSGNIRHYEHNEIEVECYDEGEEEDEYDNETDE